MDESTFVIGVDLAQAHDFTAVAVLEVVPQKRYEMSQPSKYRLQRLIEIETPPILHCRHLERYRDLRYPKVVDKVAQLCQTPELRGADLVLDATGVGRAVFDLFTQQLSPIGVQITGGNVVHHDDNSGFWNVPKRELVSSVQAPLSDGRLKFADSLPLLDVLMEELVNFRVKVSVSGHDSYEAWREGMHDDLCLATMLACWWAGKPRKVASTW